MLPALATVPNFFYHPKLFDSFFESFSIFLEKSPPKSEILGAIEITSCVDSFCRNGYSLFSHTKSYESRKCQTFGLLTVFWTFLAYYSAKTDIIDYLETTGC